MIARPFACSMAGAGTLTMRAALPGPVHLQVFVTPT